MFEDDPHPTDAELEVDPLVFRVEIRRSRRRVHVAVGATLDPAALYELLADEPAGVRVTVEAARPCWHQRIAARWPFGEDVLDAMVADHGDGCDDTMRSLAVRHFGVDGASSIAAWRTTIPGAAGEGSLGVTVSPLGLVSQTRRRRVEITIELGWRRAIERWLIRARSTRHP